MENKATTVEKLLETFKLLSSTKANEAETRKKLIDVVLEDVLGWSDTDTTYEERVSEDGKTTYADYIIRTADISLLVEAKRISNNPVSFPAVTKRRIKLSKGILGEEYSEAIIQARDYCRKKNIPFAVVTNGNAWLIFPAVRVDNVPFEESYAIVFDSLERILGEEYDLFVDLLSRDAVVEGKLAIELLGRTTDQFEERRLNQFFNNNREKHSNPIYPLIEQEVTTAFSDSIVEGDDSLIEKCYVKNAERSKFDRRINMHLQKKEALFSESPKRPMRKHDANALSESINSALSAVRPLAILILGSVGTGKSTFLQYTRKITASKYFEKKNDAIYPHWIDIDFRNFSKTENSLDFIYAHLLDYLKTDEYFRSYPKAIKPAYKKDIEALKNGPMFLIAKNEEKFAEKISELISSEYTQVRPYVDKLLKHASSNSPIFLVIDNVDQFEEDKVQSEIFSDAIALANKLNLNLVIAMRESTYVNHRASPIFDAFDFDPMYIEPPEIPAVLSKRFFLAAKLLAGKSGNFISFNGANFYVEDLSVFIDIIKSSVLGTEIGERIDVLANNDVRLALRMTREFLARGYTDPAKALRNYSSDNPYVLPKQEAFKSILLGNHSVYKEEFSVIGNPFDARLDKSNGSMLRIFILSALIRQNNSSGGYIESPEIRNNMKQIGFSEEDTLKVLKDMCEFRFIHTRSHGKAELNSGFFASRLGGHLLKVLIADFTFVENVLVDTFISDQNTWDQMKELSQEIKDERDIVHRLTLRIDRAKVFYELMCTQFNTLYQEALKRNLEQKWLGNPLEEMKSTFLGNCDRALNSAKRNYGE